MKKIKRFVLNDATLQLSASQMQELKGGEYNNVCHSLARSNCSGSCVDNEGYPGECKWIGGNYSYAGCKCETVTFGPISH